MDVPSAGRLGEHGCRTSLRNIGREAGGAIAFLAGLALFLPRAYPVLAPGGNHGELAAAGVCLGIAHPPGFPVVVQAIRLAQLLPFGNLGWRANLLAVLVAAGVLALLYQWVRSFAGPAAGAAATAALAASGSLAEEALAVEVYGASLLVLLAVARLLDREDWPLRRRIAAASLLAGIGLAGHPTIVFGLAGLLLLARPFRAAFSPRSLLAGLAFGLLGLSAFLALPIRSAAGVPVDWGSPDRWPLFVAHLTALQFRGLMLRSPPAEIAWRAGQIGRHLADSFRAPVLLLALLGLFMAPRPFRRRLLAAGVGAALLALFAVDYRIHDITAYLLPIELLAALAAAAAVARLAAAGPSRWAVALGLAMLAALLPEDRSDRHLAYDVGCHLLARVPAGGLLVSEGDHTTAALAYLSVAEGMRPDVALLDRLGNLLQRVDQLAPGLAPEVMLSLRYRGRTLVAGIQPQESEGRLLSDGLAYWRAAGGPSRLPPRAAVDGCELRGLDDLEEMAEAGRALVVLVQLARLERARLDPDYGAPSVYLEHARRAAGSFGALRFAVGRALAAAGEHRQALEDLEPAARALPFEAAVWNSLAWSRTQAGGDLEAALEEARRAVAIEPASAPSLHTLGTVLLQLGRGEEAAQALARAAALAPGSARYREDLAGARALLAPRGDP